MDYVLLIRFAPQLKRGQSVLEIHKQMIFKHLAKVNLLNEFVNRHNFFAIHLLGNILVS